MTDWSSPAQLQLDALAFMKFMHVILGLYLWEWAISLDFDWSFITGKRKFKWPLAFYFAGRYILLAALIGIAVALDSTSKVDCQGLYTFNQLAGNAAAGLASINLSLRTIAVWGNSKYVIGGLIILILGHWSLILQGVLLNATWVDGVGCTITKTNNTVLAATFIYTMCFDLVVLVLNVLKLYRPSAGGSSMATTSQLANMIFKDGVVFFVIAFLANLVATVFMVLNLNQIMNVICNVPAVVASTIVASRVVRRLSTFANRGPEVFAASTHSGGYSGSGGTRTKNGGVHVHTIQMETFARTEEPVEVPKHRTITIDTSRFPSDESHADIESKGEL